MIALVLAAALAVQAAPAPAADPHKDHAQHEGMKDSGCTMECCKDKKMPCCAKAEKKAEAPTAEGHGGHTHDH